MMTLQSWLYLGTGIAAITAWILLQRPFGRGSRYVVLILLFYTAVWAVLGQRWGYTNPWVFGLALFGGIADLAVLPWWLKHVDRDDGEDDFQND